MQTQAELRQRFEKEIRAHEAMIHKICRMYAYTDADRQDLFQDIVIQLWYAYPQFKGNSKFSTWLYRVSINTAITQLRRKRDFIVYSEPEHFAANMGDQNASTAEEERFEQLHTAIEQLNQVEKAIVMLYIEEHSYEEMEEILGISNGTLRVKMSRIKEKLRNLTKHSDHGIR